MSEFVVIPKAELEKLEAARVALYEFLEDQTKDTYFLVRLTNITAPIWNVANRKWPELMGQGEAVEPVAWISHNVRCGGKHVNFQPVVSLRPDDYIHQPLYAHPTPSAQHPAPAVDDSVVRDREYIRGLKAGWNMGIVEDSEKFQAAINARLNEINDAMKEQQDVKADN